MANSHQTSRYVKSGAFNMVIATHCIPVIAKHMRRGRQEDSHEFLRYAIDALQKSCLMGYPPYVFITPTWMLLVIIVANSENWTLKSRRQRGYIKSLVGDFDQELPAWCVGTTATHLIAYLT